jgi:hypothetical protein
MTNDERIQANADKGYILVKSFDGWEIYKKLNEVGGWTYYSDQIGYEGAYIIWNTALQSIEELQAIQQDIEANTSQKIMLKNIHKLELDAEDHFKLSKMTILPQLEHKLHFDIISADPVFVHIVAIQEPTAIITTAETIYDVVKDLFLPFVKGRNLFITALPLNSPPGTIQIQQYTAAGQS